MMWKLLSDMQLYKIWYDELECVTCEETDWRHDSQFLSREFTGRDVRSTSDVSAVRDSQLGRINTVTYNRFGPVCAYAFAHTRFLLLIDTKVEDEQGHTER